MSQSTESLEREVENRRSAVESTIDALRDRFSVGQIVDEVASYAKSGDGGAMARNLGRQVRDNPLALGLVGAGIAMLFFGGSKPAEASDARTLARGDAAPPVRYVGRDARPGVYGSDYQSDLAGDGFKASRYGVDAGLDRTSGGTSYAGSASDSADAGSDEPGLLDRATSAVSGLGGTIADGASAAASALSSAASSAASVTSRVGGAVGRAGHDTRDAAFQAGRSAAGYASDAGRYASDSGRYAADYAAETGRSAYRLANQARRSVVDTLQDEPLIVGAVALAIGAAIGASFPASRVEDEWLGETRDKLRDDALSYGTDVVQKAGHVAQEAIRTAGDEASAKGLVPTGEGETLAEKVSGVVKAAAGTLKDEAKKEGLV